MEDLRIINFPDKVFKKYLIDTFDKDGDGEISLTEALTITKVLCPQKGIKSIGFFRNLVEAQVAEDHFSFEQVKRCSPKHYSLYSF